MHARIPGSGKPVGVVVANILWQFEPTDVEDLVGPKTRHPVDFTVPELDKLFHQANKLEITGDLPGLALAPFEPTLLGYPEDGDRAHLFAARYSYQLNTNAEYFAEFNLSKTNGYLFEGKFYPLLSFVISGVEGEGDDEIIGVYFTYDPGAEVNENGVLQLPFGKSTPLYSQDLGPGTNPPGTAQLDIKEQWII